MDRTFIAPNISDIILVGTGGTGSYLAQGLAKMIAGHKLDINVDLVDFDTVEEKNCSRQNFMPWEIGQNKAKSLSFRLNQQYGLSFKGHDMRGEEFSKRNGAYGALLITCVDKIEPRKALAHHNLWLDCGNDLNYGQVIFGTTSDQSECEEEGKQLNDIPHITTLPNAYLKVGMEKLKDSKKKTVSCADTPFAEQGCFINEIAAQAALTILTQILVVGTVKTPAIWFDTHTGRWTPAKLNQNYFAV